MNIIYKFTNQITSRFYLGCTQRPEGRRLNYTQFNRSSLSKKVIEDIEKYGLENFTWEVFLTLPDKLSKKNLIRTEAHLIKTFFEAGVDLINANPLNKVNRKRGKYLKNKGYKKVELKSKRASELKKVPVIEVDKKGNIVNEWGSLKEFGEAQGYISKTCSLKKSKKFKYKYGLKKRAYTKRHVGFKRAVLQIDKITNEILYTFLSVSEASEITNISQPNISSCANGKLKTAGGYIWKFVENN